MAQVKLYTAKDMQLAKNVGKRSCSFQFIEGQEAKNHMNADAGFAVAYLSSLIANIMSNSKLEGSPEETAENIKNTILEYYKNINKES